MPESAGWNIQDLGELILGASLVVAVRAYQLFREGLNNILEELILVEFSKTIDLFKYIELEDFMSKKLGVKVDLVMKDTLKPRIKDRVLKEAIPV